MDKKAGGFTKRKGIMKKGEVTMTSKGRGFTDSESSSRGDSRPSSSNSNESGKNSNRPGSSRSGDMKVVQFIESWIIPYKPKVNPNRRLRKRPKEPSSSSSSEATNSTGGREEEDEAAGDNETQASAPSAVSLHIRSGPRTYRVSGAHEVLWNTDDEVDAKNEMGHEEDDSYIHDRKKKKALHKLFCCALIYRDESKRKHLKDNKGEAKSNDEGDATKRERDKDRPPCDVCLGGGCCHGRGGGHCQRALRKLYESSSQDEDYSNGTAPSSSRSSDSRQNTDDQTEGDGSRTGSGNPDDDEAMKTEDDDDDDESSLDAVDYDKKNDYNDFAYHFSSYDGSSDD